MISLVASNHASKLEGASSDYMSEMPRHRELTVLLF